MTDEIIDQPPEKGRGQAKLVVAAIFASGLVAFVLQNTVSTQVKWLIFNGAAPLWIVILASAIAGAVLGEAAGWWMRRRK